MSEREKRLEALLLAIAETFEAAVEHYRRPRGGQQVSFHGDFGNVMPSTVSQMARWARDIRAIVGGEG